MTWPLAVIAFERYALPHPGRRRAVLPALAMGLAAAVWLAAGGQASRWDLIGPYALDLSPIHLATNLATYARWCAAVGTPIRDLVAAADPASRLAGFAVVLAFAIFIRRERRGPTHPTAAGIAWWLAFLLPTLPLAHHTYLYYLYIPWAGGAIAVAATGAALLGRFDLAGSRGTSIARPAGKVGRSAPGKGAESGEPERSRQARGLPARAMALAVLAGFFLAEAHGIAAREHSTLDSIPADRTLREAMLLEHALPALREAALPSGTAVGFVSPVPRETFELPTGAVGLRASRAEHTAYVPLEAALRGGRAFRLFTPGLVDSGFAVSIPPGWEHVECFLYEQRGWLRRWGHGQDALMRQAELQAASGRWAAADSSFERVRSLADTLPAALLGEAVALRRLGRTRESALVAYEFARRWPDDARARLLLAPGDSGPPDRRLIRPFDLTLPAHAVR